MGEIETVDGPAAASLAAGLRQANWTIAAAAVNGVGDGWDLDDSDYEFLCECGRPGCRRTIMLSLVEYVDAQSKGYDVVAAFHEDPLDLVVGRGRGHRVIARARSLANGDRSDRSLVGNWTCGCGQEYRAAARGSRVLLWPRNSAAGYRTEPVAGICVRGCAIDVFEVLRTLIESTRQKAASS